MIRYNPKEWFSFIFKFHKADTFRQLYPMMICLGLYCWAVDYFILEHFRFSRESGFSSLNAMHSLLGFALSILLVFRTNTAYDRWWEGRKLWGGLVNSSRSLCYKLNAMLSKEDEENRQYFRLMIPNFAFILKNHLRKEFVAEELEYFSHFQDEHLDREMHMPNQIAADITERIFQLEKQGILKPYDLLILNPEIQNFADVCGACERIRNTPIPYSYSSFLKKFIFFYTASLPFGYALSLQYWTILVVIFVFYVMASLELIAEEIEDPFGRDANDLPTDQISRGIRQSVQELI